MADQIVLAGRTFVILLLALVVTALVAGCGGSDKAGDDLVLVSTRDGDYALFGMNRDGTNQGRLTKEKGDPSTSTGLLFQIEPAWSPDGGQIAFASRREGSVDIFVMNADGTNTQRLTSTKLDDEHPTWSPDGKRIAFGRSDGHLYVMRADGSATKRLTESLDPESDPAWSPDGSSIAFIHRTPGTPIREAWLMDADGGGAHRLTSLEAQSYTPAWAPDSRSIAFASNDKSKRFGIFTIGIDGKDLRRITSATSSDSFEPSWSADGNVIAFSRDGSIVTVDPRGNEVVLTDPENNDSSPAWRPARPTK